MLRKKHTTTAYPSQRNEKTHFGPFWKKVRVKYSKISIPDIRHSKTVVSKAQYLQAFQAKSSPENEHLWFEYGAASTWCG